MTSRSFPGALNVPQFDPQIADAYMGDYVANVSDGKNQYFALGRQPGRREELHVSGRPSRLDVFFARQ